MQFNNGTKIELRIFGKLKAVPELRKTKKGVSVTNATFAVDKYNPTSKEKITSWYQVTFWGKSAESISSMSHPGQLICIDADIQQEVQKITNNEGKNMSYTLITLIATSFDFLSPIKPKV